MSRSDPKDLAAGFALGVLSAEEQAEARDLLARDPALAALSEAWDMRLAPLALSGSVMPPDHLLDRIERRIFGEGRDLPGTFTRRSGEGKWLELAPGVEARLLGRIESLKRRTIMVRLQAGAEFPDHDHSQDEEIFVLEGDLIMGGLTLRSGDYHLAQSSRHHPVSRSHTGCLCIISQGYQD